MGDHNMVSNWTATIFSCSRPSSQVRRWCTCGAEAGVASTDGAGQEYYVEGGGGVYWMESKTVPMWPNNINKGNHKMSSGTTQCSSFCLIQHVHLNTKNPIHK